MRPNREQIPSRDVLAVARRRLDRAREEANSARSAFVYAIGTERESAMMRRREVAYAVYAETRGTLAELSDLAGVPRQHTTDVEPPWPTERTP